MHPLGHLSPPPDLYTNKSPWTYPPDNSSMDISLWTFSILPKCFYDMGGLGCLGSCPGGDVQWRTFLWALSRLLLEKCPRIHNNQQWAVCIVCILKQMHQWHKPECNVTFELVINWIPIYILFRPVESTRNSASAILPMNTLSSRPLILVRCPLIFWQNRSASCHENPS